MAEVGGLLRGEVAQPPKSRISPNRDKWDRVFKLALRYQ